MWVLGTALWIQSVCLDQLRLMELRCRRDLMTSEISTQLSTGRQSRICQARYQLYFLLANTDDSFSHYTSWHVFWPLQACDRTIRRLQFKRRADNSAIFFCPSWGLQRHTQSEPGIFKSRRYQKMNIWYLQLSTTSLNFNRSTHEVPKQEKRSCNWHTNTVWWIRYTIKGSRYSSSWHLLKGLPMVTTNLNHGGWPWGSIYWMSTGWCTDNTVDLYSEGDPFESQWSHQHTITHNSLSAYFTVMTMSVHEY